ncbi:MAG: hypothetical protein ABDH23_06655 [Endomicrobiia bacterium]
MKLKVLAPIKTYNGKVTVFSVQDIEVPLEYILKNMYINITSKPVFEVPNMKEELFYLKEDLLLHDIYLKHTGKLKGMIVYDDVEKLVEFLLENYIPNGTSILDKILNDSKNLKKTKLKQILIDAILRHRYGILSRTSNYISWFLALPTYLPSYDTLETMSLFFAPFYHEYDLFRILEHKKNFLIELNHQYFTILKKTQSKLIIKVVDRSSGVENIKKMLIKPNESNVLFYYDGKTTSLYHMDTWSNDLEYSLHSILKEEIYNEFNTHGISKIVDREYLVPKEFKPVYILRVPAYSEVKNDLNSVNEENSSEIVNRYRSVFLVYDTRSNLKINHNEVKTIDDPKTVLVLLSHVVNWIYSPKNNPSIDTVYRFLEDYPYYIAFGIV